MNVELELQKAIFTQLSSSSYKVNDGWFEGDILPLITIGEVNLELNDTKVNDGWQLIVTVHTWSNRTSSLQSKEMNYFVREKLGLVEIQDYRVSSRLVRTVTLKEKDGDSILHHGVTQYRYKILKEEI